MGVAAPHSGVRVALTREYRDFRPFRNDGGWGGGGVVRLDPRDSRTPMYRVTGYYYTLKGPLKPLEPSEWA